MAKTTKPVNLPPYVEAVRAKNGSHRYYARIRRGGRRIRLPNDPRSQAFKIAHKQAIYDLQNDLPATSKAAINEHTIGFLVARYLESKRFEDLAKNTKRQRMLNLNRILAKYDTVPFSQITTQRLRLDMEDMSDTPAAANIYIITWRALIRFALKFDYINLNPTLNLELYSLAGDGFLHWTQSDVSNFETAYPIGTMPRLAFEFLVTLGARQSDLIRLGPNNIENGVLKFHTKKTQVPVSIKIPESLDAAIAAMGQIGETFITSPHTGKPFKSPKSFYGWFRKHYRPLGIIAPPHGLRKAVAERLAEQGATNAEMCSLLGWKSTQMPERYLKAMDRKRIGIQSSNLLDRSNDKSCTTPPDIPAPPE